MGATVVQTAVAGWTVGSSTDRTVAFGSNVTAGNSVYVFAGNWTGPYTGCSDGVDGAYTHVGQSSQSGYDVDGWYIDDHTGGAVTVTCAGTVTYSWICIVEVSGADKTDSLDSFANAGHLNAPSGTDGIVGGSVTTTEVDQLIMSMTTNANGSTGTLSPGTGWTQLEEADTDSSGLAEYQIKAAIGSIQPTYSTSNNLWEWAILTVVVKSETLTPAEGQPQYPSTWLFHD